MQTNPFSREPENKTTPKSQAYWEQIQAEWKRSGLSQPAFCRERDIEYSTFVYWRTKLKENNKLPSKSEPVSFAEIKINPINPIKPTVVSPSEIKLRLPNGVMVCIEKNAELAQLREILLLLGVAL
jgi:hypothetical protein